MKPFRSCWTYERVVPTSPERWWRHEWSPEEGVAAHEDMLSISIEAGTPGELGCLTRIRGRMPNGDIAESMAEVVEAGPGLRAVMRNYAVGAPDVPTTSELRVEPHPEGAKLVRVFTVHTLPLTFLERAALRLSEPKRRRNYLRAMDAELDTAIAYVTAADAS